MSVILAVCLACATPSMPGDGEHRPYGQYDNAGQRINSDGEHRPYGQYDNAGQPLDDGGHRPYGQYDNTGQPVDDAEQPADDNGE